MEIDPIPCDPVMEIRCFSGSDVESEVNLAIVPGHVSSGGRGRSGRSDPFDSMIKYEVTAVVRDDVRDAFERFMIGRHIPDLMETGCFVRAELSRSASGRFRATYTAADREALDRYMNEHATRLRAHVAETFPEGIAFEREEWEVLASFQ